MILALISKLLLTIDLGSCMIFIFHNFFALEFGQ